MKLYCLFEHRTDLYTYDCDVLLGVFTTLDEAEIQQLMMMEHAPETEYVNYHIDATYFLEQLNRKVV
jgi:hypothetical protein